MLITSPYPPEQVTEKAQNFPNCPYLLKEKRCCLWLTDRLGQKIWVNPVACNFLCYQIGPYCGRPITNQVEADKFLFEYWLRTYARQSAKFAVRVKDHYTIPAKISIPSEWKQISETLSFLYQDKHFLRILLTGSVVTDAPRPLKDYDLILIYDSTRYLIEEETQIRSRLPKTINDVRVDYFISACDRTQEIKQPDAFFIQLDPESKILYTSRWFDLKLDCLAPDIKLIKIPPSETFTRLLDEAINQIESNPVNPPKVNNPGDVMAWVIHSLTGEIPCPKCLARADLMNTWGWIGCWSRREEIMGWLKEEANKLGITVEKAKLLDLFQAAWKMSGRTQELDRKDLAP